MIQKLTLHPIKQTKGGGECLPSISLQFCIQAKQKYMSVQGYPTYPIFLAKKCLPYSILFHFLDKDRSSRNVSPIFYHSVTLNRHIFFWGLIYMYFYMWQRKYFILLLNEYLGNRSFTVRRLSFSDFVVQSMYMYVFHVF